MISRSVSPITPPWKVIVSVPVTTSVTAEPSSGAAPPVPDAPVPDPPVPPAPAPLAPPGAAPAAAGRVRGGCDRAEAAGQVILEPLDDGPRQGRLLDRLAPLRRQPQLHVQGDVQGGHEDDRQGAGEQDF